jgi:two-component system OmpR family sensor kinase
MTLRRRILLGCGVIAAVLLIADLFLAATVRSILLEGVDNQLTESARRLTRLNTFRLFGPGQTQSVPAAPAQRTLVVGPPDGRNAEVLTDLFIGVVGAQTEVAPITSALGAPPTELPEIEPAAVADHLASSESELEPFTLPAADGSHDWRLVAAPGAGPEVLVVGMSLEQMADTLQRVLSIAGVMTVAILATLAAVAVWMIRLGVRPMTEMAGPPRRSPPASSTTGSRSTGPAPRPPAWVPRSTGCWSG